MSAVTLKYRHFLYVYYSCLLLSFILPCSLLANKKANYPCMYEQFHIYSKDILGVQQ